MITLEDVSKSGDRARGTKTILASVNFHIPTDRRIALLGPPTTEKRALVNLLAGTAMPERGRIVRHASVSFPAGDLPGFSRELSIRVNVAHVARLYGADVRGVIETVERVLNMGHHFDRPFQTLPNTMRKTLAQAVVFSLPFDSYLVPDDKLARDWSRWQKAESRGKVATDIRALFGARMRRAGMIILTADQEFARAHCELGLFLHRGQLALTSDMMDPFQPERVERQKARALARRQSRLAGQRRDDD